MRCLYSLVAKSGPTVINYGNADQKKDPKFRVIGPTISCKKKFTKYFETRSLHGWIRWSFLCLFRLTR